MSHSFRCRQIDKYDGQYVFCGNKIVYDLGNYLGGGASGSVYQATDPTSLNGEKSVAIKILNPLGFKNTIVGLVNKCSVAVKGQPLSQEQIHSKCPMHVENVWWLIHPVSKVIFAAYEDPHRQQLKELPLPKCVEVWGWTPLGCDVLSDLEVDKLNWVSGTSVWLDGSSVRVPAVSPKFLKFLRNRQSVCREMSNMVQIGEHPNIVDLLEVLELVQDTKTTLFLVLELVSGGELFERMRAGGGCGSEDFARRYFVQLLSGVDYCHQKGVVHRDLKPENLLLSDPSDSAILKIADFGLSAIIFAAENNAAIGGGAQQDSKESKECKESVAGSKVGAQTAGQKGTIAAHEDKQPAKIRHAAATASVTYSGAATTAAGSVFLTPSKSLAGSAQLGPPPHTPLQSDVAPGLLRRLKSVVGSPHYIAPEIASNDPSGYDGRQADMWSAGVVLYSLLTGALPFGGDLAACPRYRRYKQWLGTEWASAAKEGRDAPLPAWFLPAGAAASVGSLLVGLLHCEPSQRMTAAEAIKHPWCAVTAADAKFAGAVGVERNLFGSKPAGANTRSSVDRVSGQTSPVDEEQLCAQMHSSAALRTATHAAVRRSPVGNNSRGNSSGSDHSGGHR